MGTMLRSGSETNVFDFQSREEYHVIRFVSAGLTRLCVMPNKISIGTRSSPEAVHIEETKVLVNRPRPHSNALLPQITSLPSARLLVARLVQQASERF